MYSVCDSAFIPLPISHLGKTSIPVKSTHSLVSSNLLKIANVCCTHGDELIGEYIYQEFPRGSNDKYSWKSIMANEEAKGKSRYTEADLNRCFPGKKDSNIYEEKRAYELMRHLNGSDLIIDWHQSRAEMDDLIIIKKKTPLVMEICSAFDIEHIMELDGSHQKDDYTGLLIDQFENAIAIEYGDCNPDESMNGCLNTSRAKLLAIEAFKNILSQKRPFPHKKIYRMFGTVKIEIGESLSLKNFMPLNKEEKKVLRIPMEKEIYPAFINGYKDDGIYCRLLEKVS